MTTKKTSTDAKLSAVETKPLDKATEANTVPVISLKEGTKFKFQSGKFTYKIMTIIKKGKKIVGLELEDSLNRLCNAKCDQTLGSQVILV